MYRTSDIAKKNHIHPNTVRFYERLGFISAVPRAANGYRVFDRRHLTQVRVLRCIFLDDWPGNAIRKTSMNIITAMKTWDLTAARQHTLTYKKTIETETEKARHAIHILEQWSDTLKIMDGEETYNRQEASSLLGVTPEALRNWERNDLICIPRRGQHQTRVYGPQEMKRLKVIYLLRQARFSMSAIHNCLVKLDAGNLREALKSLENPDEETAIWTGDRWLAVLQRTASKADEILRILNEAEKL